jgi:predicted 3-demethylubiquinone-9 3-methyltransferase (glyoxalase superfamily)
MTIDFEVEGQKILGLNGCPLFKFTQGFSEEN